MGNCNCLDFRRGVSWIDDDEWDIFEDDSSGHCSSETDEEAKTGNKNKRKYNENPRFDPEIDTGATKVKIKITKKQLEEILKQADNKSLPIQEVLASLVKMGESCKQHREQHWKPNLQSIPEIAE